MHIDKKLMHRIFGLIAGTIIFGWLVLDTARATMLFSRVWELVAPFVAGAGIAFIFNVPMRAIEKQLDGIHKASLRRTLALLLTLLCLVLIIMFIFELLVPQIRLTLASLSEKIPAFVDRTAQNLMVLVEENPELGRWIQEAFHLESLDWSNILKDILTWVANQVSTVMGGAVNVIGNVTTGIVNMVISVVFAIYCLGRKEILARQGRRILYSVLSERRADEVIRVMRLTNATFSNFISGQCLEAVILGCLFAVVMAILKMPYIPLVSVIIAVTALIPVVGAFVGCIVGAFFILVNDPIQAVSFIAMFLVLQQLENNLIYPRVVGTSIGLPGMWVLVAVTIGGELMGVGGMLVMIPLVSVVYTLGREFTNKRLAERGIPEYKLVEQPPEIKSQFQQNKERKERMKLQKMREQLKKLQEQQKKK
ncbi:MAG: AI-2E family transporter [Oscillospiraceae bacterium]|nr:AI-2E family transporter [Oscillospiraceae bacterium]